MQSFRHRWSRFELRRPRNPLLRVGIALLGIAVLALLLAFGLFIGLAMLAFAGARRLLRALLPAQAPGAAGQRNDDDVLEGEYNVVRKQHDLIPR